MARRVLQGESISLNVPADGFSTSDPTAVAPPVTPAPVAAPVAAATPTVTTTSGTPSGIYQLTPSMLSQLEQAVSAAFPSGFGSNAKVTVTNGQIADNITNFLAATGQWSSAMLQLVHDSAMGVPGASNPAGVEESKSNNLSAFVSQWLGPIESSLNGALIAPPSAGTGSGTTGSNVGTADATSATIASLLSLLGGNSSQGQVTPASSATLPSAPYYVAPVSGGSGGINPIAIIILLAAIGIGIWWYMKKKKHHAPAEAHAE